MNTILEYLTDHLFYLAGFICILFASQYASRFFQKVKLPLITGFLVAGVICGPHVLGLIKEEAIENLGFVNDLSLGFIAFAAGSELFLKEIRGQLKNIAIHSTTQLLATFLASSVAVFFLADLIPFMQDMGTGAKIGVAILAATIFVARSPSSAIAVINEMRAKGPFTQTAIGVTVVIDVAVIVLFAICFSFADTLIAAEPLSLQTMLPLLAELAVAFLIGFLLSKLITFFLLIPIPVIFKTLLILAAGFSVFEVAHFVHEFSPEYIGIDFHIEPMLSCIIGSFLVTNFSKYREEFQNIVHDTGPVVYVAFFTLTGAMLSIDILAKVWLIALILFTVRVVSMIIGSLLGSAITRESKLHRRVGWMPYVTQAGVGLGLAMEVSSKFDAWGSEFATIIIAVIVVNQFVGPPFFKWALNLVGEAHGRAQTPEFDGVKDAMIFGLEGQSRSLARQLKSHGWSAELVTLKKKEEITQAPDIDIKYLENLEPDSLALLKLKKVDALVLLLSDEENYAICEWVYEHIGTKEIIVRLNQHSNFNRFHELGALVVHPTTAMVSLLDHLVRSPVAASLLLGMEENQDTEDIEVRDKEMNGVHLRDLRLPPDLVILSVKRGDQVILSHGYTQLKLGDILAVVGSPDSIETIRLKFEEVEIPMS